MRDHKVSGRVVSPPLRHKSDAKTKKQETPHSPFSRLMPEHPNPQRRAFSHWFILLLALAMAHCAPFRPKVTADLSKTSPDEIVSRIRENQNRIRTLTGRGRIIVEGPRARFAGQARFYIKNPDSLFIIAKAALGVEVGFFFADRRHFSSYSPIENVHYSGPVSEMSKLMLFQLEIDYEDVVRSVLGTAVFPFTTSTKVHVADNRYIFRQRWRKMDLIYEVDPARFAVTRVYLRNAAGKVVAKQTFSRFKKHGNVWIPQHIRLLRPRTREQLTIFYESVAINKPIAPEYFQYKIPENARHVRLKKKTGP